MNHDHQTKARNHQSSTQTGKEAARKEVAGVGAGAASREGGGMIFQHTLEQVLAQKKTQTSRIWKDNYVLVDDEPLTGNKVYSTTESKYGIARKLHYIDQELAVQPTRGSKGIARIRITELAKRDVRDFSSEDVKREGFSDFRQFIQVWSSMHDKWLYKKAMRETFDFFAAVGVRPDELYTALVIRFELVAEQKAAA